VTDSDHEHQTVLERKELSARQVHAALRLEGEEELERTTPGLFWSAVACGITLGLSLLAQGLLRYRLPDTAWRPLIASIGYSLGFIAETLGRQELYTGNTLTAILPALQQRRIDMLPGVLRVWGIVLVGNIVGAAVFACAAAWTSAFSEPLRHEFVNLGVEQVRDGFWIAFAKGIFGGWLIALMIWLMPGAHHARIWVIAMITWCLAAAELTHAIAGSVDVLFGVMSGAITFGAYIGQFLVPVLLGNTIGSVVFVGALNHGQVASDDAAEESPTRTRLVAGKRR